MGVMLRAGADVAEIDPQMGGGLLRLSTGSSQQWLVAPDNHTPAMFVTVPWFSRIFPNGQDSFEWLGTAVQAAQDFPIHGFARHQPWQVQGQTDSTLALRFEHPGSAQWTWSFVSQLTYALSRGQLNVTLDITNLSATAMPCGLGLHPYIGQPEGVRLQAGVNEVCVLDAQGKPVPPFTEPHGALDELVAARERDHVFLGWQGACRLSWPQRQMGLSSNAEYLVVYSPSDQPWFCVEPVTNLPDGFNRMTQDPRACRILSAGETHQLELQITYNAQL